MGTKPSASNQHQHDDTIDSRLPCYHKWDFPIFNGNGKGDPMTWLSRCEQFFHGQHTVEEEKIWIAAFHLTDEAQECYTHAEEANGTPLRRRVKEMVELRFSPPLRHNKLGTLAELRRIGSVADYQEKFMSLLSRLVHLWRYKK